ncbi:MAG: PrgI family protein [Patescibacteria group bacterium]
MEPHPIPQNISSFEFRLIGDMTLKQFVYLATGSTLAYIIFVFFAAPYPLLAWPLILIFASLGAAFAFLGVGSRPLDYWLAAFLKTIYSPTKRVWRKNNKIYKEDPLFQSRYITYLSSLPASPTFGEASRGEQPTQISTPSAVPFPTSIPPTSAPSDLPTPDELKKTVDLAREAQNLQMQIIQTERTLSQIRSEAQKPTPIPIDYTNQVNDILSNLQKLMMEASQIKGQLDVIAGPEKERAKPLEMPKVVKIVMLTKPKPQQVALTTFPNVINGITKDNSGNYLEGVIAVIHDKEGLPVRALKTNRLGQFTGSTPLPNGVYTLELEKENFSFDVLQIELTGEVLPPLMITAKEAARV